MLSCGRFIQFPSALALGNFTFLRLKETDSQGFQPSQKILVGPPSRQPGRLGDRFRFGDGRAFGFQIDRDVFVRGVDAGVPQPVGDGAEIHSRFEQMDRSAMTQAVRVDSFAFQRWQNC